MIWGGAEFGATLNKVCEQSSNAINIKLSASTVDICTEKHAKNQKLIALLV